VVFGQNEKRSGLKNGLPLLICEEWEKNYKPTQALVCASQTILNMFNSPPISGVSDPIPWWHGFARSACYAVIA
jgi:hypothetical protein